MPDDVIGLLMRCVDVDDDGDIVVDLEKARIDCRAVVIVSDINGGEYEHSAAITQSDTINRLVICRDRQ